MSDVETSREIRVLTLNCWGLKYVSRYRSQRIRAIAAELVQSDYDLIGLQEIWVPSDYEYIKAEISSHLPYNKFFRSGALGAGLCMFSRFPIVDADIRPFSLNGSPLDVIGGDWYVGKAVASIVIEHPSLGLVDFLNTHFHARGGDTGPETVRTHRNANAWQFARRASSPGIHSRYVIATGDFNSIPSSLSLSILKNHGHLTDAWEASHDSSSFPPPSDVSAEEAMLLYGITADSLVNTFSAAKNLPPDVKANHGKRLDYVFYRDPLLSDPAALSLRCSHSRVVFTGHVPGANYSYSDHFGVEATLMIERSSRSAGSRNSGPPRDDAIQIFRQTLFSSKESSERLSSRHLSGFVITLGVLSVIIVASLSITIPQVEYLIILLTIGLAWLATTLLYVGFIFGRWERGAMINMIEELDLLHEKGKL